MKRLILAIRALFRTLFSGEVAARVELALSGGDVPGEPAEAPTAEPKPTEPKKPSPPKPARNDAIALLAELQREARLVDFIQEPLDEYSDAQIGSVVRDVHRDCGKVLARLFALAPLDSREQGSAVQLPAGFDPGRYRLVGAVAGDAPFAGELVHHGWEATKCELPSWTGKPESARVVAPAEVDMKPAGPAAPA